MKVKITVIPVCFDACLSLFLLQNKTSEYAEPGATPRSEVFNFHQQVSSNYPPERSNSVIKQISAQGKNHTHKSHIHTCKYGKYMYTTEDCCTGTHTHRNTQSTKNIIKYNTACHGISCRSHSHSPEALYENHQSASHPISSYLSSSSSSSVILPYVRKTYTSKKAWNLRPSQDYSHGLKRGVIIL